MILNENTTTYKKAYKVKTRGKTLIVGFKGNLTKTRKLSIAREFLTFLDNHDIPYQKLSNPDGQLEASLSTIERVGGVYNHVKVIDYDFKKDNGDIIRYIDIKTLNSMSIANFPQDVTTLTIG